MIFLNFSNCLSDISANLPSVSRFESSVADGSIASLLVSFISSLFSFEGSGSVNNSNSGKITDDCFGETFPESELVKFIIINRRMQN